MGAVCITLLDHPLQQDVDLILPAAKVSAIHKVVVLLLPPSIGGVQLKGPQEVAGRLEVRADSEDLMDQILHTNDAKLTCNMERGTL